MYVCCGLTAPCYPQMGTQAEGTAPVGATWPLSWAQGKRTRAIPHGLQKVCLRSDTCFSCSPVCVLRQLPGEAWCQQGGGGGGQDHRSRTGVFDRRVVRSSTVIRITSLFRESLGFSLPSPLISNNLALQKQFEVKNWKIPI